jgi:hypothetical protein
MLARPSMVAVQRASGLTIISDLDGTLLPRPTGLADGTVTHPNLSEGPCYRPLVRLLDLGCKVVGVTGSRLATHQERFFDELPLAHRKAGNVWLAVQTGSCLYKGSPVDGSPMECEAFSATLRRKVSTSIPLDVVEVLIESGRKGIRRFFADLQADPSLVDANGPLGYLHGCDASEVPITQDDQTVPRIEVRDGQSAVVFVGVPSSLGANYFEVDARAAHAVDGRPTGRACFDCVPKGLDKSLVMEYLIESGLVGGEHRDDASTGAWRGALALGDQPKGNDEGLTRWHRAALPSCVGVVDIPFVSVSEAERMVPTHLRESHLTCASNAEASALLLEAIADLIEADAARADGTQSEAPREMERGTQETRLSSEMVVALTSRLNEQHSAVAPCPCPDP